MRTLVGAGGGHNLVGLVEGAVWAWGQTRASSAGAPVQLAPGI